MKRYPFSTNISIRTKLILPIVLFSLVCGFLGTRVIENELNTQIYKQHQKEITQFSRRIHYTLISDYETLFYNFGTNIDYFAQASNAAQQESIARLQGILEESSYEAYIRLANGHTVPLSKPELTPLLEDSLPAPKKVSITKDHFVYLQHFKPWQWDVVLLKDLQSAHTIIEKNSLLVFGTILLLMAAITLFLLFIIHRVIHKPFLRLFNHLDTLSKTLDTPPLALKTSKETLLLSKHINAMSQHLRAHQEELVTQREYYNDILKSQPSLVIVSSGTKMRYANDAFFRFFDQFQDVEDFLTHYECVCDLFEPVAKDDFVYKTETNAWIDEILYSDTPKKALAINDGIPHTFTLTANLVGAKTDEFVITMTDITAIETYKELLEKRKEELNRQLHTDELTQLPNRLSLSEILKEEKQGSLILFNINDFKEINDFYGTQTGDKILREYGVRLQSLAHKQKLETFKLSGDEYALYLSDHRSCEETASLIHSLLDAMDSEIFYDAANKRRINASATAGLALHTAHDLLLIHADIALKTAKKKRKNIMTFQDSQETQSQFAANIEWAHRLKEAFAQDRIVPYFQPIYSNATHKIEKYEALVRMIDKQGKEISPYFFLDVAKKSHQYFQLTEAMIEKTFAYMQDKPFEFSINLSESDLMDYTINALIINKLAQFGIGERVVFEIVETEKIEDYELVAHFIKEVKRFGAKIAIDDFGSGFSNFQHISRLNIDYLKIDGSLVQNILDDSNSLAIVETIQAFATRLGIETIAEFVESEAIFNKVREIGIHHAQGYYIARPKPTL
jgi:diguanylate cyclase (GGDEF)-like protein